MKKMITAIIVDDEQASINKLQKDLKLFPEIKLLDTTTSVDIARKMIVHKQPDVLFLDVEMPTQSGLELLRELQSEIHPDMKIVFYTAYNKYMLDAFRASAFDYLLKPYLPDELETIVERVKKHTSTSKTTIEHLLHKLLQQDNRFAIQTIKGVMMVRYDDVLMFEYPEDKRNWIMKFTNGEEYTIRSGVTYKDIVSIHSTFIQINQRCIINLTYLASIEGKGTKCLLYPPFENIDLDITYKYYKKIKQELDIL